MVCINLVLDCGDILSVCPAGSILWAAPLPVLFLSFYTSPLFFNVLHDVGSFISLRLLRSVRGREGRL